MGLESTTYISGLNSLYPEVGDSKTEGDDHIRLIKSTLLATFPSITGAVSATHTEINTAVDWTQGVKAFGAVGDGTTDDTVAIQAAIDVAGIRNVYFPKGTYKVTAPISVVANVHLYGEGIGKTVIDATTAFTSTQAVFHADTVDGVTISDLTIDGNTNGTNGAGTGIHLETGSGNSVIRVRVLDTTQAGIRINEQNNCIVDSCVLDDCGRNGYSDNHGIMVYSAGAVTMFNVKVTNNTVRGTYRKGITTYAPTATFKDVLIHGNTVTGSGLGNIYAGGPSHTAIRITDNYCADAYVNIQFGEGSDSVISGNTCVSATGNFGIGIFGTARTVVTGNIVQDSELSGISFFQSGASTNDYLSVTGNVVNDSNRADSGAAAIELSYTSNSTFVGNVIYDTTGVILASYGIYENVGSDYNLIAANRVLNVASENYFRTGSNTIVNEWKQGSVVNLGAGLQVLHATATMTNGANNNVTLPALAGVVSISGPTAVYNITGIAGGSLGREITLINNTAYVLTLSTGSGSSTDGNRIYASGGGDLAVPAYSAVKLVYGSSGGTFYWLTT